MADGNNADSHHSLNVDTLHQLPRDIQGSENSLPLSPQWLLPKPGDIKHGMESHLNPFPGLASRGGTTKLSRDGEDAHSSEKKRDVFRPSVHDLEAGRRDRWRDEERDTNSAIRRDRRKDGEKESGDNSKMDRWGETPTRHSGEPRRAPSDRWNDSSTRDANFDQRRDNKWNTRWGPDDKESESWREKSQDSVRDSELPRDKVLSHVTNHGKEDKDVDHHRPWRSSSFQSRGRGEPPHQQTLTQKPPAFNYGRGRGEYSPPSFSVGRGRIGSSGSVLSNTSSHSLGAVSDKGEGSHLDHSLFKYSRIKLLDIYRTAAVSSHERLLDEYSEVPTSLTQAEALEPLALSAPSPEEVVILKGIDKGDIVSSGLPQISKEGSIGRSSTDIGQLGRAKIGSKEDLPSAYDDYKVENTDDPHTAPLSYSSSHFEKYAHPYGSDNLQMHNDTKFSHEAMQSDPASHNRANEASISREVTMQGSPVYPAAPWRSESMVERSQASAHDWKDLPPQFRSRTSETSWQNREGVYSEYGSESTIKRQLSDALDRDQEARKSMQHTSPEDLSLYYKDPQGEIQGPFSGVDLIGWFEAGYFGIDLQVRIANALPGTPFSSLGDVMPHLRAKAKAPPGFGAPKPNDIPEMINRPSLSNLGMLQANSSEIDILKNEARSRNESMTEVENRFLESLMSGSLGSSPLGKFGSSEGLQGYMGNTPVGMPGMGPESGKDINYLLAQRMSLERQRSLSNPHYATSVPIKSELGSDSPTQQSKLLPSMIDSNRQVPLSQGVDLMSLLQGVADKSASSAINNGVPSWSNFPVQGGLETRQDKMDMHHNQHFPQTAYGLQQQIEKLLSSGGLSQDPPQMLNLLKQQYMLSQLQLQSQTPVPPQLSSLELYQQQQQQQQQQAQQLQHAHYQKLQHQQMQEKQMKKLALHQLLISQALSENHKHITGPVVPAMSGPVGYGSPFEVYQSNSQVPLPGAFPSQISQDAGHRASSEASALGLPHQVFANTNQEIQDTTRGEQIDETLRKESLLVPAMAGNIPISEMTRNSLNEISVLQNGIIPERFSSGMEDHTLQTTQTGDSFPPDSIHISRADSKEVSMPEQVDSLWGPTPDILAEVHNEQIHSEPPLAKEIKGDEALEGKKISEKKSKKQKNSKGNASSEKVKGTLQSKQNEIERISPNDSKIGVSTAADHFLESVEGKVQDQPNEAELVSQQQVPTQSNIRAWKPAPGVKAKSLLEIQQEEERVAQKQIASSDAAAPASFVSSPMPWTGIVSNAEPKIFRDTRVQEAKSDSTSKAKSKKSPLHDLLAEEVLAKSEDKVLEKESSLPSIPVIPVDDDNFIQAKDSKKNRKKSGKGKGSVVKSSPPVDAVFASSPVEKSKSNRQLEKEVLPPAPPSGPSLGDFVVWKGESTNNTAPGPAWLTDSGKLTKPASIRDIQKEQGKRGSSIAPTPQQAPIPTPQKPQSTRGNRGTSSTSPTPINFIGSSQSKSRVDDDLFWGPLDQSKQESKQSGFPSLGSKGIPAKGSSSRQKLTGSSKAVGRTDTMTKQSEAMDFRDWCESETVRLTGSKDTSFLEFCLKQTTSEAETLLVENLGTFDPDHEFIEKFLNYKELLSADVLEIAFQGGRKVPAAVGGNTHHHHQNNNTKTLAREIDYEMSPSGTNESTKGGKKKGKKGKKVSPSVLGFNVVSNRIMMGEIQTIEE
ncbi:hypothetical protein ACHQM5_017067 [Ranunculus cassubicifolius]